MLLANAAIIRWGEVHSRMCWAASRSRPDLRPRIYRHPSSISEMRLKISAEGVELTAGFRRPGACRCSISGRPTVSVSFLICTDVVGCARYSPRRRA